MKILLDSYSTVFQNTSGGMKIKIKYFDKYMRAVNEVKLFDKWTDNVSDYDIVHIFLCSHQAYELAKYAKSLNKPVVVSAVKESSRILSLRITEIIGNLLHIQTSYKMDAEILRIADKVIAETDYEKDFLVKGYKVNEKKISVIPNGVNLEFENYKPGYFRKMTGIDGNFILQVGRFDSNKNQYNTIKAVNETKLQLVLIGGPDKDEFEYYEKCRQIAGDNIHFLGWVDHTDPLLIGAYHECKTFILPSYKEILGNAMIEAAACGANIVVTNVLPIEKWGIKDLCMTVDPDDYEDIRAKLLISDKQQKNGELKQKIGQLFSWEEAIREHNELYCQLLKDKEK